MLSDDDIVRVRCGWAAAAVDPDRTAAAFYSHLFRVAPEARALFQEDMTVQRRKLAQTLDTIVDALDAPDRLLPIARQLARRHVAYGVRPEHYDAVGAALQAALGDLLGSTFTPADRLAWSRVYEALSTEMREAAYPAGASGGPGGPDPAPGNTAR